MPFYFAKRLTVEGEKQKKAKGIQLKKKSFIHQDQSIEKQKTEKLT